MGLFLKESEKLQDGGMFEAWMDGNLRNKKEKNINITILLGHAYQIQDKKSRSIENMSCLSSTHKGRNFFLNFFIIQYLYE